MKYGRVGETKKHTHKVILVLFELHDVVSMLIKEQIPPCRDVWYSHVFDWSACLRAAGEDLREGNVESMGAENLPCTYVAGHC